MENLSANTENKHIEMWKIKRMMKRLEASKGNGTSMVTYVITPNDTIQQVQGFLAGEYSQAANIKSKTTMNSVQQAITSTKEKLKLYKSVPKNGLVIFCGQILMDDNKTEKKITLDIEPFRPVQSKMYKCENKFHAECLNYLLEDDEKFGFVIVDGNGALFATLQGNVRNILHKLSVELPKKHGRGGQSANRFARLREEKRHAYVRKIAELTVQCFITNDRPNVKGIVMAGSADFKTVIGESDLMDKRMKEIIVGTYDVSYGGENGLNQAVTQAADCLANVRFVEERNLVQNFFEQISLDTGMIVFGVTDSMKALEMSALEKVLLYDEIEHTRYVIKNPVSGESKTWYLTKSQEEDPKYFKDQNSGIELEVVESDALGDWLCLHYAEFGCKVELITDKTQEGYQFVKGFGGIGGLLRYKIDVDEIMDNNADLGGDDFDADEDFI